MFIKQFKNKSYLEPIQVLVTFLKICLFITIFIVFISKISFASQKTPISIIAKVDNQIITDVDLNNRYNLVLKISKIKIKNQQEKQAVLHQILQRMIDEELQIKEAIKLKIFLDQTQLNQSLEEISNEWKINSKKIKYFLSKNNLSYNSLVKQIKAQILWSEIIKNIAHKIKISQAEIDELLELRKINSNIKKFFLLEIFIPFNYKNQNDNLDSKELALKIYEELQSGESFPSFVKQFSRSLTAEFNGEVGWVGKGDIDNKIYLEIEKIKIGNVTKPILMEDGYYLFKATKQKTFSTLTNQDFQQLTNIIFNKKLQLLTKEYLMNLHKNAYIIIDY